MMEEIVELNEEFSIVKGFYPAYRTAIEGLENEFHRELKAIAKKYSLKLNQLYERIQADGETKPRMED
jgi:predicted DNA-binding ribbon-helix-helix protein